MGIIWSMFSDSPYDTTIPDNKSFIIIIHMHISNVLQNEDINSILEYIKDTGVAFAEIKHNKIYCTYDPTITEPLLRSNIISEIISYVASEFSIWIIKNTKIDLQMLNISLNIIS